MALLVQKFGGSSLSDTARLEVCADRERLLVDQLTGLGAEDAGAEDLARVRIADDLDESGRLAVRDVAAVRAHRHHARRARGPRNRRASPRAGRLCR